MGKPSGYSRSIARLLKALLIIFLLFNIVIASHAWKFTHFYNDPSLRKPQETGFFASLGIIFLGSKIPKSQLGKTPATSYETFHLKLEDGTKIEGWKINPATRLLQKPAILMFHGHGGSRSGIIKEEDWFVSHGYEVYMIDFRAHGNSSGEQSLVGMKESEEVKALYDYASKQEKNGIIMFGVSMGASTILKAMDDYKIQPTKLILEMPFATLVDAAKGKLRIMHLPTSLAGPLTFYGGLLNGKWGFSYEPYRYAAEINCPVLLQWGRNDPRVNEYETREIYNNIHTAKKLVIYENSAHESLLQKEPAKWSSNMASFLQ